MCIVIYNLLEILSYFRQLGSTTSLRTFKVVGGLCTLTQVISPVMAYFETADIAQIHAGIYEHNPLYFTRNSLTTLAIAVLSCYNLSTCYYLNLHLEKQKAFHEVNMRVRILTVLMEVVLCLRLGMIWSQNTFWYMQNQWGWLLILITYQVAANILPIMGFIVVATN